ncbi:MAG: acylphosphatase [Candidatus Kappaea frigidicola]|nr:acylphosphatase [Candidatus Kappaea frigidicola]
MKQQARILFRGSVQGVGFRWAARKYAVSNHLCGWVKNLPNGNVELIAQGKKEEIVNFINDLEEFMGGYILEKRVDFQELQQGFNDFEIRF